MLPIILQSIGEYVYLIVADFPSNLFDGKIILISQCNQLENNNKLIVRQL